MIPSWLRIPLAAVGVVLAGTLPLLAAPQSAAVRSDPPTASNISGTMLLAAAMPVNNVATATCMGCHGSSPKYPILGARQSYDHSGHKNNGNSMYANGGGCQQCHTNEGFIEFVKNGKVDDKAFVKNPSQPGCTTCHAPHENGDMRLRTTKAVALANKGTFDHGKGNLCASCHKSRSDVANMVKPTAANTISGSWGAHHGPQADMIEGTNAYQVPGKSYSNSSHTTEIDHSCTTCHMALPQGRYGFSPALGGHSMNISGDVHENELLNTSGCVSCHKDMKQQPGTTAWSKAGGGGVIWIDKPVVFNITADADYDQNGKKEAVQDEVQGLMNRLVNKDGSGLLQTIKPPMYSATGAYIGNKSTETLPVEKVGALYNYKYILEDRSRGIHNANYTFQLLYDTIGMLDPKFDTALRPK